MKKILLKKKKKITKVGLWTRKAIKNNSNSKERKLIDKLANSISIEVIKKDLNYCKINNLSPLYIIRTLYRFAPEFEKAEVDLNKIIKLFRFSLYYDYAKAVLTSKINRNWHKEVILFLNRNQ